MHTCGPMVLNLFVGLDDPMIDVLRSPAARSGREKPFRPEDASYASRQSANRWSPSAMRLVASFVALMRSGEVVRVSALNLEARRMSRVEG